MANDRMSAADLDLLILELLGHGAANVDLLRYRIADRIGAMSTPKKPAITGRLRALAADGKVKQIRHAYSDRVPAVWRKT